MKSINDVFGKQKEQLEKDSISDLSSIVFEHDNVYIKFSINGTHHVSHVDSVKEVIEMKEIQPLPIPDDAVIGIINLRGTIIPIFRMGKELLESNNDNRVLVFDLGNDINIGIIVSDLKRVFIPAKDTNLGDEEVITYENVPVKFFNPKIFFLNQEGELHEE